MAATEKRRIMLMAMYEAMLARLGPSRWWPGDSPFEVVLGAVLTQNTNWGNVEKALQRLRAATALNPAAVAALSREELEEAIRPSGFFRQKAERIHAVLAFLRDLAEQAGLDGSADDAQLACLAHLETDALRHKLLSIRGIGPETADSILLYAAERPSFVVDAYTQRICRRHGLLPEDAGYEELQAYFMDALPASAALYNEYHALIVRVAKEYCRKAKPLCDHCPLAEFLEYTPEY